MKKYTSYRNLLLIFVFVLFSVSFLGCTGMLVRMVGMPLIQEMRVKIQNTDSIRLAQEGVSASVLLTTGIVEMQPHNFDALTEASFLYCAHGLFVEDKDPEFAKELYAIGKSYGIRALKTDSSFRKRYEDGEKIKDLVDDLGDEYGPALCWTALNSGLLIVQKMDDPVALMDMPDVMAMMTKSLAIDPDFFYGVGTLFMGTYYAILPEFLGLGGGPVNSRKMFDKAREKFPNNVMIDVFQARYLSTYLDDEDEFDELLNKAIEADSSKLEGAKLINELAKVKAKFYLAHKEKYF